MREWEIPKIIIWKLTCWFQIQQLQNPPVGGITNKELCVWLSAQLLSQDTLSCGSKGPPGPAALLFCSSSILKGQGDTRVKKDTREDFPPTTRTKSSISLISLQVHKLLSTIPKSSLKTKRFFRIHLKVKPELNWQEAVFSHFFICSHVHTLNCRHADMFDELLPQPPWGCHGICNISKTDCLHDVRNIRNFETHLTPRISDKGLWDSLGDTTAQKARQVTELSTYSIFLLTLTYSKVISPSCAPSFTESCPNSNVI